LESHAPIILSNGSLLTFTRSAYAPHEPACSIFTVASEEGWNGTYRVLDAKPTFPFSLEDTFMWQDPKGHFHALFHSFIKGAVGGHAFSLDGTNWTFGGKRNGFVQDGAYSLDVEVASQDQDQDNSTTSTTTVTLARRERPHLLLDAVGNPIALTNGVQPPAGGGGGGGGSGVDTKDWTYTAVFLIKSA
jgi:hypothetical protein